MLTLPTVKHFLLNSLVSVLFLPFPCFVLQHEKQWRKLANSADSDDDDDDGDVAMEDAAEDEAEAEAEERLGVAPQI